MELLDTEQKKGKLNLNMGPEKVSEPKPSTLRRTCSSGTRTNAKNSKLKTKPSV